jgi:hypothetical protein
VAATAPKGRSAARPGGGRSNGTGTGRDAEVPVEQSLPGASRALVWVYDESAGRWSQVRPQVVLRYDEAAAAWYETIRAPGAES